ncbi:MAG: hypothetical protein ACYCPF_17855 [Streptosporangiaceae bacterium]
MLLSVVSAIVALLASIALPVSVVGHRVPATGSGHASSPGVPGAPRSFDPLAIWVTFGWLPRGFSLSAPANPETPSQASMAAAGSHGELSLTVFAADQCELTGPFSPPQQPGSSSRYPAGLRCKLGKMAPVTYPVRPAGHLADGDRAYRMMALNERSPSGRHLSWPRRVGVVWEYARGGWATLTSTGATWSDVKRVATGVRYGSHVRHPFPFKLVGIPADLKPTGVEYQEVKGQLIGHALYLSTRQDPGAVQLTVEPAFQPSCLFSAGQTRSVSFEGAHGVLVSTPNEKQQDVCFPSLHHWFVLFTVHDQIGGVMGMLRHVRILGPDRADWTTYPLG